MHGLLNISIFVQHCTMAEWLNGWLIQPLPLGRVPTLDVRKPCRCTLYYWQHAGSSLLLI
jgi:hypothetical protein